MAERPPADRVADFVTAVRGIGVDTDARGIAEMLWLAQHLPGNPLPIKGTAAEPDQNWLEPEPLEPIHDPHTQTASRRETASATGAQTRGVYAREEGPAITSATAIRVPGARALPRTLELERALRPLRRRRASETVFTLDVERTAERSAELDMIFPVMRPQRERWFEVALVADAAPSLAIWRETLSELARLLERHDAFRDLRRWTLRDGAPFSLAAESGLIHDPRTLADRSARRLILIVTDGTAPCWHDPRTWRIIASWARATPTAFVQLLPERLWANTAIGDAPARVSSVMPGVPNAGLVVERPWYAEGGDIAFPVITLTAESLSAWASVVMGAAARVPATFGITATAEKADEEPADGAPAPEPSAEERVRRFKRLVSPAAYQLAVYISGVPLVLPLMRLVQRLMLPASELANLAEVILGGILARTNEGADGEATYRFHVGVRAELRESLLRSEAVSLLRAMSSYVSANLGTPIDFVALIADPAGTERLPAAAVPFATIGAELMAGFAPSLGDVLLTSNPIAGPSDANAPKAETTAGAPPDVAQETRPRILVAGSAMTRGVPAVQLAMSEYVGAALARARLQLATGLWPGVDSAVFRAYEYEVTQKGRISPPAPVRVYRNTRRFDVEPRRPMEIIDVDGYAALTVPASECAAAIVIGGGRGTKRVRDAFLSIKKPVLPIAKTGGDAKTLLQWMRKSKRIDRVIDLFAVDVLSSAEEPSLEFAQHVIALAETFAIRAADAAYRAAARWFLQTIGTDGIGLILRSRNRDAERFLAQLFEVAVPGESLEKASVRYDSLDRLIRPLFEVRVETRSLVAQARWAARWITLFCVRLGALRSQWPPASDLQDAIFGEILRAGALSDLLLMVLLRPDEANRLSDWLAASLVQLQSGDARERAEPLQSPESPLEQGPFRLAGSIVDRPANIFDIAFTPDGEALAIAGRDGLVRIYALRDGRCLQAFDAADRELPYPRGAGRRRLNTVAAASAVAFSPEIPRLATCCSDGSIAVWPLEGGPALHTALAAEPARCAWLSGSRFLAVGTARGEIVVIDVSGEAPIRNAEGTPHNGPVTRIDVAPSRMRTGTEFLYSRGGDTVCRWQFTGGRLVLVYTTRLAGGIGSAMSSTGSYAVPSRDGTIFVHSDAGGVTARLDGDPSEAVDVAFSPDANFLATCNADGAVSLWDLRTASIVGSGVVPSSELSAPLVRFDPTGRHIAVTGYSGSAVHVWAVPPSSREIGTHWLYRPPDIIRSAFRVVRVLEAALLAVVAFADGVARSGYVQLFLRYEGTYHVAAERLDARKRRYDIASEGGVIARAFSGGAPVLVHDVAADAGYIAAEKSTKSEYAFPIPGPSDVFGVLNVELETTTGLSPAQIGQLENLAKACGPALMDRASEIPSLFRARPPA